MSAKNIVQQKNKPHNVTDAYSSPYWWYDIRGLFILTFAYRGSLLRQIRFFGTNIGSRHLDIAIGSGSLLHLMRKWRRRQGLPEVSIVGVDYAERMLAGAAKRFSNDDNVILQQADAGCLPFQDAVFDSVNVANALHCFPDASQALAEAYRVLKPGGTMALNVLLFPRGARVLRSLAEMINRWGIKKGILVTPYSEDDVREMLRRAGFNIESSRVFGNGLEVLARKL